MIIQMELHAIALVSKWVSRLENVRIRFASTYRAEVAPTSRVLDTLVLEPYVDDNGITNAPPAAVLREALLVWHSVSSCVGLSFGENAPLWGSLLRGLLREPLGSGQTFNQAFPRVVLFWNTSSSGRSRTYFDPTMFQTHFLDFFDPKTPTSSECLADLSTLDAFQIRRPRLDCALRFCFAPTHSLTRRIFSLVSKRLPAMALINQTCRGLQLTEVQLLGRRCVQDDWGGLRIGDLTFIEKLCDKMPTGLELSLRVIGQFVPAPKNNPPMVVSSMVLRSLLSRLIGIEGTGYAGRLRVLDLTQAFPGSSFGRGSFRPAGLELNFPSLCTLLPYSKTIEDVRLQLRKPDDLLWVLYFAFHPRLTQTRLRSLALIGGKKQAHYDVAKRLIDAREPLREMARLLTNDVAGVRQSLPRARASAGCSRCSARTRHLTEVFELGESTVLVSLEAGTVIECAEFSDRDELVVVAVAGFGIGVVATSDLESFEETIHPSSLTTPICSLHMDEQGGAGKCTFTFLFEAFGPNLKHLRTRAPLRVLEEKGLTACLESLSCAFETPKHYVAPMLPPSLSIMCHEHDMEACFTTLAQHHKKLRDLTLRLNVLSAKGFYDILLPKLDELFRDGEGVVTIEVFLGTLPQTEAQFERSDQIGDSTQLKEHPHGEEKVSIHERSALYFVQLELQQSC